jgi:hypothetical protein
MNRIVSVNRVQLLRVRRYTSFALIVAAIFLIAAVTYSYYHSLGGSGYRTFKAIIFIVGASSLVSGLVLARLSWLQDFSFLFDPMALAAVVGIVIVLPDAVGSSPLPNGDSGVFLYTGWRILKGEIPYIQVWDHKPPLIFFIDAFGLWIGNSSPWGVWLIEFIVLYLASLLLYLTLHKYFGTLPALVTLGLWLLAIGQMIVGGNMTEEYALVFQCASLWVFSRTQRNAPGLWAKLLMGVCGGITLLLKQTLISVWITILLYLLIENFRERRWRNLLTDFMLMVIGFLIPIGITAFYFTWHNGLGTFWEVAFQYNFYYSEQLSLASRIGQFVEGLPDWVGSGLSLVGLAGWGIYGWRFLSQHNADIKKNALLRLSVIGFPITLMLTLTSGRAYVYYYVPLLPFFAVLAAALLADIQRWWRKRQATPPVQNISQRMFGAGLAIGALVLIGFTPIGGCACNLVRFYARFDKVLDLMSGNPRDENGIVDYINAKTSEGDYVLIWGNQATVNFATRRVSPTRFVYQYPLYTTGYHTEAMVSEFLRALETKTPKLIVDTTSSTRIIPPLDPDRRQQWLNQPFDCWLAVDKNMPGCSLLPSMKQVFAFVSQNYRLVGRVGVAGWYIYQYAAATAAR